jgi:hypothetical protein
MISNACDVADKRGIVCRLLVQATFPKAQAMIDIACDVANKRGVVRKLLVQAFGKVCRHIGVPLPDHRLICIFR